MAEFPASADAGHGSDRLRPASRPAAIYASQIIIDDGANYSFVASTPTDQLQIPSSGTLISLSSMDTSPSTATITTPIVSQTNSTFEVSGSGTLDVEGAEHRRGRDAPGRQPRRPEGLRFDQPRLAYVHAALPEPANEHLQRCDYRPRRGRRRYERLGADGTLVLASATNTYSGPTNIAYGTLQLHKDPTLLTSASLGTGPLTIGTDATLDLHGCSITVNSLK